METRDVSSIVTLLKEISSGIHWYANNVETVKGDEEEFGVAEHQESVGAIVVDMVKILLQKDAPLQKLDELLQVHSFKFVLTLFMFCLYH